MGLAGEFAHHRKAGPVVAEALPYFDVVGVVGRALLGRDWAASKSAQRSAGGPCRARWPRVRLPSDDQTVMSMPVWRTAWRDDEKRRVSPISAQIMGAVSAPTP